MEGFSQLLIFGGSLIAILGIYGLTRWLKLGGKPILSDHDAAIRVAEEIVDGFNANRVSISRTGDAGLLRDSHGRILIVKQHGGHFAGRILTASASAREEVDALIVDPGKAERQFGTVRLRLDDAASWADAINRL
ncbi:hypothetical protein AUC45_08085 [Erythrobacter sp. YT30]|nr:hypothetical protein AUC45_08085 [Erythrobacter sp. YT30]